MSVVFSYAAYPAIGLAAIIWVARTLARDGRTFLLEVFHGNRTVADSINRVLVAGFYLIALGYLLGTSSRIVPSGSNDNLFQLIVSKVGWLLVVLGLVHVSSLFIFGRMRKRGGGRPAQSGGWNAGAPLGKVLD